MPKSKKIKSERNETVYNNSIENSVNGDKKDKKRKKSKTKLKNEIGEFNLKLESNGSFELNNLTENNITNESTGSSRASSRESSLDPYQNVNSKTNRILIKQESTDFNKNLLSQAPSIKSESSSLYNFGDQNHSTEHEEEESEEDTSTLKRLKLNNGANSMHFEENGYLDDINKSGLYGSSEYSQDYNSIKLSMSQDPNYQLNYIPSSLTDSNYLNFDNQTQTSDNSLYKPSAFINPSNLPKIKYTQYFLKDLRYLHKSLVMLDLQKFNQILLKKCILETIHMRWKWPESIETREEIENKFMDHMLTPQDLKIIESEDLLNASATTISSNAQIPFYKPFKTSDKLKENSENEDSNANYTQTNKLHNIAPNLRFNIVQKFESTRKLVDSLLKKHQGISEEDELRIRRAVSMKLQLIFEQLSHSNDKEYYCKNKGDYPYNLNLYGKAYLAGIPESVIERARRRMEPLRERIRMVEGLNANKFKDGVEVISKNKYL